MYAMTLNENLSKDLSYTGISLNDDEENIY